MTTSTNPAPEADPIQWAAVQVRRLAAGSTVVMMLISWPLWLDGSILPRVPFVAGLGWRESTSAGLFVASLVSTVLVAVTNRWRPWFVLSATTLTGLILADQHRFQPWAYLYLMVVGFLAALPGAMGLRLARWWFIALYIHSGLSKLDVSFRDDLGPIFLRGGLGILGIDPATWSASARQAAVLAMPAGELLVGVLLLFTATRQVGRVGALVLHGTLLLILGPLGLGHSTLVLLWNLAVASQVWCGFRPAMDRVEPASSWLRKPALAVFWVGVILPLGERSGWFDAWPSHALYASHVERTDLLLSETALERFPDVVRRHARELGEDDSADPGRWWRVNLTDMSRDLRGTPVYPGNRACLGLAEGLVARYGGREPVRVVMFGPADRWTGQRQRTEAQGLDAIRRLGHGHWLNAHPAW